MFRIMLTMAFAVGLTAPALAQVECEAEANEVWMAVQASDIPEEQLNEVQSHLEAATAQGAAGDEETCLAMVDQLRLALGMEPASPGDEGTGLN